MKLKEEEGGQEQDGWTQSETSRSLKTQTEDGTFWKKGYSYGRQENETRLTALNNTNVGKIKNMSNSVNAFPGRSATAPFRSHNRDEVNAGGIRAD